MPSLFILSPELQQEGCRHSLLSPPLPHSPPLSLALASGFTTVLGSGNGCINIAAFSLLGGRGWVLSIQRKGQKKDHRGEEGKEALPEEAKRVRTETTIGIQ